MDLRPNEEVKRNSSDDDDAYDVTFVFMQEGSEIRKLSKYFNAAATKLSAVR